MIHSVYDVLDAYKHQGRINLPAALKALQLSDLSEARRTALTPESEFTIDMLAQCNDRLGKYLALRKSVTWDDLRKMFSSCYTNVRRYWDSKGWNAGDTSEYDLSIRHYAINSVKAYYEAQSAHPPKFDKLVEEVGCKLGRTDSEISWVQHKGPWMCLPQLIRQANAKDVEEMFGLYDSARDGWSIVPGDYSHIHYRSELEYVELVSRVSYADQGVQLAHYDSVGMRSAIQKRIPELSKWCDDPANPDIHVDWFGCGSVLYMVITSRAVYFFNAGGKPFAEPMIDSMLLWNTWLDANAMGSTKALKYYNGVIFDRGTIRAREDITTKIYERIGYIADGSQSYPEAMRDYIEATREKR